MGLDSGSVAKELMWSLPKSAVEYEIVSEAVFGEEIQGRRIRSHY